MDQMTSAQQAQQSNRDRSGRYRTKPHTESDTSLASATARSDAHLDGDGEPSQPRVDGVPGDALVNGFDAGRLDGYSRFYPPMDETCYQYRRALHGIGDDDLAAICRTQTSRHCGDPSGPGCYKMFLPNNEWQRRSTVYRRHESDRVLARRLVAHADTGDTVADPIEKMDVRATRAELDSRYPAAREERITWVQQATDRQLAADRTGWRHFLAAIPDTGASR